MQHAKIDKNIEYLIKANYQRMMAYEHASFISDNQMLIAFYAERADESEHNLKELYKCLEMTDAEAEELAARIMNKSVTNFRSQIFNGRKNSMKILESANLLEKTILQWHKGVIAEIKLLSKDIVQLITRQYHLLEEAKLNLAHL